MQRQESFKNLLLISMFSAALVLLYWVWLFYTTQSAVDSNTYSSQHQIHEVKIEIASHRGSDKLYIFTQDNCYMLNLGWRNEVRSYKFAEKIQTSNETVFITVWDHFPRDIGEAIVFGTKVQQVVDLRSDDVVFWDIEKHNYYQSRERLFGIIAGVLLSVVLIAFGFLVRCGRTRRT